MKLVWPFRHPPSRHLRSSDAWLKRSVSDGGDTAPDAPDFSLRAILCSPTLLDPVRMRAKLLTICVSFSSLGISSPGSRRYYAFILPHRSFFSRSVPPICHVGLSWSKQFNIMRRSFQCKSPMPDGQKFGGNGKRLSKLEVCSHFFILHRYLIDQSTSTSVPSFLPGTHGAKPIWTADNDQIISE